MPIQLDGNFAMPMNGLGAAYVNKVFKGYGGAEDFERAEAAFSKALAIDPQLVESRMLMVFVYLWRGEKAKGPRRKSHRCAKRRQRSGRVFRQSDAAPTGWRVRASVAQF